MIRYLTETLGIQYFPRPLSTENELHSNSKFQWLQPNQEIRLFFVLTDTKDSEWSAAHELVYQNIIKALGLKTHEVLKFNLVELSLLDFFSKLRQENCHLPTVFFSQDPDLNSGVKTLGSHKWVEIYSFTEMMKKPELKKISWKTLQALQAQGL